MVPAQRSVRPRRLRELDPIPLLTIGINQFIVVSSRVRPRRLRGRDPTLPLTAGL
jgi:hypothetical protein